MKLLDDEREKPYLSPIVWLEELPCLHGLLEAHVIFKILEVFLLVQADTFLLMMNEFVLW